MQKYLHSEKLDQYVPNTSNLFFSLKYDIYFSMNTNKYFDYIPMKYIDFSDSI